MKHTVLSMQNTLQLFQMTGIQIDTADVIDSKLRKETCNPSIGIDFFTIDDDSFKESLYNLIHNNFTIGDVVMFTLDALTNRNDVVLTVPITRFLPELLMPLLPITLTIV